MSPVFVFSAREPSYIHEKLRGKLTAKSLVCTFLGYAKKRLLSRAPPDKALSLSRATSYLTRGDREAP